MSRGRRIPAISLVYLLAAAFAVEVATAGFDIGDATIDEIHAEFRSGKLTSRRLVEHYLAQIRDLNPLLSAVIEVNPDALSDAGRSDRERRRRAGGKLPPLDGIPILIKDNIATKDKLNTTSGSLALLGSSPPRDAGVVRRLRKAGAIVLGKASLSEWANFRSFNAPDGWSARGGQGKNPYVLSASPCGSSSGSAIAAAADLATVTLGTETDGSILCPSAANSVVGIKPTVGLTSRAGVIPISPRQDTVGPICRTVSDAVQVLDAIVGFDPRDEEATKEASEFIPRGGYKQFLKVDGLKGKRLGILRKGFFDKYPKGSSQAIAYEQHFDTMRQKGAILVDNLEIANADIILGSNSGEDTALHAEFKVAINSYLSDLVSSPVGALTDIIAFDDNHKVVEMIEEFGQQIFLISEQTEITEPVVKEALSNLTRLNKQGIVKMMAEQRLDAIVTTDADASPILAIGGHPGIVVPAGYAGDGSPFGISFGGLRGSEPTLIQIAYGFEQATKVRKPPTFKVRPSP